MSQYYIGWPWGAAVEPVWGEDVTDTLPLKILWVVGEKCRTDLV